MNAKKIRIFIVIMTIMILYLKQTIIHIEVFAKKSLSFCNLCEHNIAKYNTIDIISHVV